MHRIVIGKQNLHLLDVGTHQICVKSEAPYQPAAMPDYDAAAGSSMAQVFVASYVIDTAG